MVLSNTFLKALTFTLRWEGGLSNHKEDLGGLTNRGITQATYNRYLKEVIKKPASSVKNITEAEVKDIYHRLYWLPSGCDKLPEKLAIAVFDTAVNMGNHRAVSILQEILGAKPDGIFGAKTENHLKYYLSKHTEKVLLSGYLTRREVLYYSFAKVGKQRVFLQGWLNRLNDLKRYLV